MKTEAKLMGMEYVMVAEDIQVNVPIPVEKITLPDIEFEDMSKLLEGFLK